MFSVEIILIALSLSMDCFAVSISSGITIPKLNFFKALKPALFFATFQAGMPILGWLLGIAFSKYMEQIDHYVAFLILSLIGVKMIIDAYKKAEQNPFVMTDMKILLGLSVATSIDAFIIGLGFAFLKFPIVPSLSAIWIITFIMTMLGLLIARHVGPYFGKRAGLIGGIALIAIGLKILFQHLGYIQF